MAPVSNFPTVKAYRVLTLSAVQHASRIPFPYLYFSLNDSLAHL